MDRIEEKIDRTELSISEMQIYTTQWYKAMLRLYRDKLWNAPIERISLNETLNKEII